MILIFEDARLAAPNCVLCALWNCSDSVRFVSRKGFTILAQYYCLLAITTLEGFEGWLHCNYAGAAFLPRLTFPFEKPWHCQLWITPLNADSRIVILSCTHSTSPSVNNILSYLSLGRLTFG